MPRMVSNTKAQAKELQDTAIDELGRIQHDLGGPLVSIAELNKANMVSAHPGVDSFTGSGHIVHRVDMAGSLTKGAWLHKATIANDSTTRTDGVDFGDKVTRNAEAHIVPMRLVFVKARDEGVANLARWLVHNKHTQEVIDAGQEQARAFEEKHNEAVKTKDNKSRKNKPKDIPI
jgi:hypothetical protein